MAKLHKLPTLKFRRVENDATNPMGPIARWIAQLLEPIVVSLSSSVRDSKTVLAELEALILGLGTEMNIFLIASDIVDYFLKIDITDAQAVVAERVITFYGPRCGRFINSLLARILEHKFFKLNLRGASHILRKKQSLSIGEYIATGMANIYRHSKLEDVNRHQAGLAKHYGYVDDCLSILVCEQRHVQQTRSGDPSYALQRRSGGASSYVLRELLLQLARAGSVQGNGVQEKTNERRRTLHSSPERGAFRETASRRKRLRPSAHLLR